MNWSVLNSINQIKCIFMLIVCCVRRQLKWLEEINVRKDCAYCSFFQLFWAVLQTDL